MKQQIDAVLDFSTQLQKIRERLTQIEQEKAALEAEAAEILTKMRTVSGHWTNDPRLPLTQRIVGFLAAHPQQQFRVAAIAHALGYKRDSEVDTVRGTLARLVLDRRVQRTGYGCYMHQPGAV
jgi:hypothetical protein